MIDQKDQLVLSKGTLLKINDKIHEDFVISDYLQVNIQILLDAKSVDIMMLTNLFL